jgi:threonyl-tRNA synthetase
LKRIPYLLIVGEKEEANQTVALRKQGQGDLGSFSISDFIDLIQNEIKAITEE